MNPARRLHCLFAFLLLIGQQSGVLHQLGHGLGDAARIIAAVERAGTASADSGRPAKEADAGACPLCLGFAGVAALPTPTGTPPAPGLAFARPLADVAEVRPLARTGTPIRAPPADLSSLA